MLRKSSYLSGSRKKTSHFYGRMICVNSLFATQYTAGSFLLKRALRFPHNNWETRAFPSSTCSAAPETSRQPQGRDALEHLDHIGGGVKGRSGDDACAVPTKEETESYFKMMKRRFPEVESTFKKDKISEKNGKITLVEELDIDPLDRITEE